MLNLLVWEKDVWLWEFLGWVGGVLLVDVRKLVVKVGVENVFFDWDLLWMCEGFYCFVGGIWVCIVRGIVFVLYCDLLWMEMVKLDINEVREFVEGVKVVYLELMLVYNLLLLFNWDVVGMNEV